MLLNWAKSYVPRSLYGRAALILLVPVVLLQLVVSIVFIQRHYEGVTEQMSRSVALEVRLLIDTVNAHEDPEQAITATMKIGQPLQFAVKLGAEAPAEDLRRRFDLSARAMMRIFRNRLTEIESIDASHNKDVVLWAQTRHGTMLFVFKRARVSASNPHQLLVLMVLVSILLTCIAFVFLRNQLRPIRRLARASEAFGKGRNVEYRPAGATEVRAAGRAFLDMRSRIERQIEQRTMMLSGISHDLRTPLTRLRLALSMQEDLPEARDMLGDVIDMERLLDEFLAFARDDALDEPKIMNPVAIVADMVDRIRAGGGNVSLRPHRIDEDLQVSVQPMALSRAVDNLIGNALHYGTNCIVSVTLQERTFRIEVEDDGPGIPPNQRDSALTPFVRLDHARNQNKGGGVGLGLAIARDMARRHGGTLVLGESVEMGGLRAVLIIAR